MNISTTWFLLDFSWLVEIFVESHNISILDCEERPRRGLFWVYEKETVLRDERANEDWKNETETVKTGNKFGFKKM